MSLDTVLSMFDAGGNFCDHFTIKIDGIGGVDVIPNALAPYFPGCDISISSHSVNLRLRNMYPTTLSKDQVHGLVKEMLSNCPYTTLVSKSKFDLIERQYERKISIGSVEDGADVRIWLGVDNTPIYQLAIRDNMVQGELSSELDRLVILHNAIADLVHHLDDVIATLPPTRPGYVDAPVDVEQPQSLGEAAGAGSIAKNAGLAPTDVPYADPAVVDPTPAPANIADTLPDRPATKETLADRFMRENPVAQRMKNINKETLTRVESSINQIVKEVGRQVQQPAETSPIDFNEGYLTLQNSAGSKLNIIFNGSVSVLAETGALTKFIAGMGPVQKDGDIIHVQQYTGWTNRLSAILNEFKIGEAVRARPTRTLPEDLEAMYPLADFFHI